MLDHWSQSPTAHVPRKLEIEWDEIHESTAELNDGGRRWSSGNEAMARCVFDVTLTQALNPKVNMFEPLEVKALSGYRLWIRYADGTEGEVDLSHLAGRGVFTLWEDEARWRSVRIAEDGAIRWSEEVELCPDATYLKLTGKSPEEVFPKLKSATDA
jgi:hypothetical protein